MSLPKTAAERKAIPVATGCLDYFPDSIAAVAELSRIGNDQHNPGQPLHWDRSKSTDEADCMLRHFIQRGTLDTDGVRHSAKVAWRALAILQKEIEAEAAKPRTMYEVMRKMAEERSFKIGDRVNLKEYSIGDNPGCVIAFDPPGSGYATVKWDRGKIVRHSLSNLRHGE